MPKTNTHAGVKSMLVFSLLAFSAFAGAVALANDSEDQNSGSSSGDSVSESAKQAEEKAQETTKKQAERQREAAKQQLERNREAAKQQLERTRETNKQQMEQSGRQAKLDSSITLVDGEDNSGKFRGRTETLSKLQEKLAEAEKKILEKQAEGVDVTVALVRLADAKAKVASVGNAFDANNTASAKQFSEEARKLAHFALDKDMLDPEKISKQNEKADERLNQVKEKLAKLKALGGDTSSFESSLASVQSLLIKAKSELGSGDPKGAADLVAAQKQLNAIKDGLRSAIFALNGKDNQFGDDHKSEVDDVADNLDDVADIEDDSVGPKIRVLANAQRSSAEKVSGLLQDAQNRSKLAEFLVGARQDTLSKIEDEVKNNETQVATLESTAKQVQDPEVKKILDEQISALKQGSEKLRNFVADQSAKTGLFSWLTRWF